MKIGVITQPLLNNYGGLLQAYALQNVLKKMGHKAIVLDRHNAKATLKNKALAPFKTAILRCLRRQKDHVFFPFYPSEEQSNIIAQNTSGFIQKYIDVTSILYSTEALRRAFDKGNFDAIIVGSDQVWRPCYSNIPDCFLDFIKEVKGVKRLTYAASFGVECWEYSDKLTRSCSGLTQQFDAISVREDTAVRLCRKYLGSNATHVLDPTMLLEPDDYIDLVLEQEELVSAGNLMTYVLDPTPEKKELIQLVESVLGLKSFTVMSEKSLTRKTQYEIEECVFPRVTQWLRGYMDAKFVIADSFHGCVFAILFNIPFIAIGNSKRGMARFNSLLKQFGLSQRLVLSTANLNDNIMQKSIDWDRVNEIRAKLKVNSINFLKVNLR
jgi:hypothetical protein